MNNYKIYKYSYSILFAKIYFVLFTLNLVITISIHLSLWHLPVVGFNKSISDELLLVSIPKCRNTHTTSSHPRSSFWAINLLTIHRIQTLNLGLGITLGTSVRSVFQLSRHIYIYIKPCSAKTWQKHKRTNYTIIYYASE